MALNYNFTKYKDIYTLENLGLVVLTYSVYRIECDSETLVKTAEIKVGQTIELPIKHIDGVYRVTISDGVLEETLPDILFYNNLLLTIIDGVEESLCGCKGCSNCEDCTTCESYLKTIVTELAFAFVYNPRYSPYINDIAETLKCDINATVLCLLLNEAILAKTEVEELYKKIIALYYLAFYLYDLNQAVDAEEAIYIKEKYVSAKILKCIKKLGINIDETTDIFTDDMQVYYWQLEDPISDIADVIPLIDQTYLITKPVVDFSVFEAGNIVNYTSIGRAVFAIKETDITNFVIVDSLNNDVTDEFDTYYFIGDRTALFVSKLAYSHSNMYFKFKKNLYV